MLIDIIGNCLKFLIGYALVLSGFGVYGILISFLTYTVLVGSAALVILFRRFGIILGRSDIKLAKELTKAGLINTPFKLSKVFIITPTTILMS
jgi:hypothetical protein